jgi:hypothetical protein
MAERRVRISLDLRTSLTTLYAQPTTQEMGSVPYISLWLRYTAFIVLYPLGVASELTMVYLALPTIKKTGMWSWPMPNVANFAVDYFWVCIAVCIVSCQGAIERRPSWRVAAEGEGKMAGQRSLEV